MWRNEPPTEKQLLAIMNIARGFNLSFKDVKTKGEAHDEIQRLNKEIESKKAHYYHPSYKYQGGMSPINEWAYEMGIGPFH